LAQIAKLDMGTLPAGLYLLVTDDSDLMPKEQMRERPQFV
jgi:hypothetical protein